MQGMVHRFRLSFSRHYTDDMPALQQGRYRQRERMLGDCRQGQKASVVHLLLPATRIQRNNLYCLRIMKISYRRIIESNMIVFSYAHADDVGRLQFQQIGISPAFGSQVCGGAPHKKGGPSPGVVSKMM